MCPIWSFLFLMPYALFIVRNHKVAITSVADPNFSIPDPDPQNLSIFNPKNCLWSGMFIPDPDLDFYTHPGFKKRHRIPDPDPQHWLLLYILNLAVLLGCWVRRTSNILFGVAVCNRKKYLRLLYMWESRRLIITLEEKTYWLAYSFTCFMIFPGGSVDTYI